MTGPWGFDLTETLSGVKTQTATAKIFVSQTTGPWGFDLTENAAGLKTQTATAKIASLQTSGPWGFDLSESSPHATQTATAKIAGLLNTTQNATANISDWFVDATLPANSTSFNDYAVSHGSTYQYRVVPVTNGVDGTYVYSANITYSGGTGSSKTQTAMARIAASLNSKNGMIMGVNF